MEAVKHAIEAREVLKATLAKIKKELRELYGVISVEELTSNRELVLEIEVLERMLTQQGV